MKKKKTFYVKYYIFSIFKASDFILNAYCQYADVCPEFQIKVVIEIEDFITKKISRIILFHIFRIYFGTFDSQPNEDPLNKRLYT